MGRSNVCVCVHASKYCQNNSRKAKGSHKVTVCVCAHTGFSNGEAERTTVRKKLVGAHGHIVYVRVSGFPPNSSKLRLSVQQQATTYTGNL